ncbi:hypothetical protein HG452_000245 [Candidatus Saccharibacteria bacterium]|nr:hypothetical protein [Candidatus Saccharibacteria bacterium]
MKPKKYNPEEIYPAPEEKTDKNQNPQESENNAFILEEYKVIRKGKSEDFIPIQIAAILGSLSLFPASSPAPIINYGFSLLSVIAVSYSLKAANKFEIETGRKSKAKIWAEILLTLQIGVFVLYLISGIFSAGGILNGIKLF